MGLVGRNMTYTEGNADQGNRANVILQQFNTSKQHIIHLRRFQGVMVGELDLHPASQQAGRQLGGPMSSVIVPIPESLSNVQLWHSRG